MTSKFDIFVRHIFRSYMDCRPDCGACCIAISISSPIPGIPEGKPAGVKCIHLFDDYRCALWGNPLRPKVCLDFKAEEDFCGKDREEALKILRSLESPTNPLDPR